MHAAIAFIINTWYIYAVAIIATFWVMGEEDDRRMNWEAERRARERARSILRSMAAWFDNGNRSGMAPGNDSSGASRGNRMVA